MALSAKSAMASPALSRRPHVASVTFPAARDLGPREWGCEELVAFLPGHFTGKVLLLNAGHKGGLQYHREKHEFAYLISGELIVRYDAGGPARDLHEVVLHDGQLIEIPPGAVHQEEAVTDCVIFEVSTPVFNDRVRVEEQYGLPPVGGLPTTQQEAIRYEP